VSRPRVRKAVAYAGAVAAAWVALLATLQLGAVLARNQLVLFAAAVILSAWFGGLGPGLVVTVLSAVAANYFLSEPLYTLGVKEPREAVGVLVFVALAVMYSGLHSALRRAHHRAEAATRIRDLLFASLSHDLKHPLTAIQGQAQLLRRRIGQLAPDTAAPASERLDRIDAATARMARMIEELVDLVHAESGEALALRREPTDLVALARAAVEEQRQPNPGHDLRLEADAPVVRGEWDQRRLERVLGNLLANAIKYSPEGGQIVVRVGLDAARKWGCLHVHDQGIGIPAGDLATVFEPFRRGANVNGRIDGSGVGLAGARQIVLAHGGTIEVTSCEGEGTNVEVRLPL
jgi:signal transduction histidine kinase